MDAAGADMLIRDQTRVPKDVLIIVVNAEVNPERSIEQSAGKPSVMDTVDAFSNAQIALYNQETQMLIAEKIHKMESELGQRGHPVKFYLAEVSFASLKEKSLKSFFNNLPTSLELTDSEIDVLISTGRSQLRKAPEYRAFLAANSGRTD
jgi:NTE family protein